MGRRHHDPVADRRMDPQCSKARCGMFPDPGGLVGVMGRGHEGKFDMIIVIVTV